MNDKSNFKIEYSAFSLIELMVVIAIVALLAAIAVPAYKNYVLEAKLAEALNYMKIAKTELEEKYAINGSFCAGTFEEYYTRDLATSNAHRFRCNQPTNSSAYALQYIFNGSFDDSVINGTIQMRPTVTDNGITWVCSTIGTFPSNVSPC
jgi:type IV pilus assembly protein PilA